MTQHDVASAIPLSEQQRKDAREIASYYANLLDRFGDDARSLDWGSTASQELRFAVLAKIADLSGASILDVGCGLADFHGWLRRADIPHTYTGIDLTPEMTARAAARFPSATILCGDFAEACHFGPHSFDYVFASGIFAFCRHEPQRYLDAVVAKMFHLCCKGVAFNSLSGWRTNKEPGEFYPNPVKVASRCAGLTTSLVLRHDYHPGDFTVYLYQDAYWT